MREIRREQLSALVDGRVFENMRKQYGIEEPCVDIDKLRWRIGLESAGAADLDRLLVVVDSNAVAIDEREASTNPTADIESASKVQPPEVPSIRIRNESLPTSPG
jgi:hypothetical protein